MDDCNGWPQHIVGSACIKLPGGIGLLILATEAGLKDRMSKLRFREARRVVRGGFGRVTGCGIGPPRVIRADLFDVSRSYHGNLMFGKMIIRRQRIHTI